MCRARPARGTLFALFIAFSAYADITGKVIAVADGDTLTVLIDQRQIRVRLIDIDAPESGQPYGQQSKESLAKICAGKQAPVADNGKDRFGRTLGRVTCEKVDANAEQVRRGMAWVFDRYVKGRSLYSLQDEARAAKRGLWTDPDPVSPWEWRKGMR